MTGRDATARYSRRPTIEAHSSCYGKSTCVGWYVLRQVQNYPYSQYRKLAYYLEDELTPEEVTMVTLRFEHDLQAPTLLQWTPSTRTPQATSEPGYSSDDPTQHSKGRVLTHDLRLQPPRLEIE